jgi:DNA (cytosine-5)-methyltransferase 1
MSHIKPPVRSVPGRETDQGPTAISLFAGCGGFCEGMELAGFKIKCAVELDRFAALTYRQNFPSVPLFDRDVHDYLNTRGEDHIKKYQLQEMDVVFGGPPCQGYSQIGTRDLKDKRNDLYQQFARIVAELKPKMFVMENVPNILLLRKGHFRNLILKKFVKIGYGNTACFKVSAADHAVPQLRHRVFFVGTRDDTRLQFDLRQFFEAELQRVAVKKPFTVWQAIGDLPPQVVASGETMAYPAHRSPSQFARMMRLDCDGEPYTKAYKRTRGLGSLPLALYNHHTKEIQDRRKRLISLLRPGEKGDSLPKNVWNGMRPEKWRRLDPNQPSYTILAQMHRDLSEWVHPSLERWISVREAARLQSFHDGFIFCGSEWQQLKQIGNAVPPLLAYAIGRVTARILKCINADDGTESEQFVQSLLFASCKAEPLVCE